MPLVLDSLEIKNFRAFKHLRIEKLGRVNLIVGKNNVGKSSVLEALRLYAYKGDPHIIFTLLEERDELSLAQGRRFRHNDNDVRKIISSLRHLFHGRQNIRADSVPIMISDLQNNYIAVSIYWPTTSLFISDSSEQPASVEEVYVPNKLAPRIQIRTNNDIFVQFPLDGNYSKRSFQPDLEPAMVHCISIGHAGLGLDEVGILWNNIALYDSESDALSSLQLIDARIKAVNLVGSDGPDGLPIPRVRLLGVDVPIPLRSMGEGMNRMFGIALALVNAKDGMLLIDEVDTGLHYSVLPDLWKLIFEVAHRLNVQVFATSHSWDCIQAFQSAAANNENEEGVLIRLEERKAGVGAVVFDERDLAIVTREQIEVR